MNIVGIDLGGTQLRGGLVQHGRVSDAISFRIPSAGSEEDVLQELYRLTDQLVNPTVRGIGIGVPSVVDINQGIVYDVQNIPSWKEVPLKAYLEERYHIPVWVNNDANCFALGEKYFGKGQQVSSMIGLTIGTGLGAGIIIDNKLYSGPNCGAGEFGMVDYLDQYYEYYASGQFFRNIYQTDGEVVFQKAKQGDPEALACYKAFGVHLGNAIKMILYTHDPEMIVLGGSIRHAYPYFQQTAWERIHTFVYPKSLERFHIEISELKDGGILGAAALCYEHTLA